jgi:hypothetical protein
MKKKFLVLTAAVLSTTVMADTASWINTGDGLIWDTPENWSSGSVPTGITDVSISSTPALNNASPDFVGQRVIALTNNDINSIQSINFTNALTGSVSIVGAAAESLAIGGNISNTSAFSQTFALPVEVSANSTVSGSLNFSNQFSTGIKTVTLASGANVTFSNVIVFTINSVSSFGKFSGSGFTSNMTGATINISGTSFTGSLGNSFDFTTGNFTNATLGTLPTLTAGLAWNTSQFISSGILTVVSAIPEPSTYAALLGVLVLGLAASRKRRPSA